MEFSHRRSKSAVSSPRGSNLKFKIDVNPSLLFTSLKSRRLDTSRTRPTTAATKLTNRSRKYSKIKSARDSLQIFDLREINKSMKSTQLQEIYYSTQLKLSDNSSILQQDAFRLQNLITGGYCCDDQFMSLSKFNQAKDNFILLNEIYDKAKVHPKIKKYQKHPGKSRNIFSVIYLNQNLKHLCKTEAQKIFDQLKIVP